MGLEFIIIFFFLAVFSGCISLSFLLVLYGVERLVGFGSVSSGKGGKAVT
jgi:hypothetical protein